MIAQRAWLECAAGHARFRVATTSRRRHHRSRYARTGRDGRDGTGRDGTGRDGTGRDIDGSRGRRLASMAVAQRSVLRFRRYRSRRQVLPTTSARSADRRAHHPRTGESGAAWAWARERRVWRRRLRPATRCGGSPSTVPAMNLDEARGFVREHHHGVLATRDAVDRVQQSPVLVNVDGEGRAIVSSRETAYKVRN